MHIGELIKGDMVSCSEQAVLLACVGGGDTAFIFFIELCMVLLLASLRATPF